MTSDYLAETIFKNLWTRLISLWTAPEMMMFFDVFVQHGGQFPGTLYPRHWGLQRNICSYSERMHALSRSKNSIVQLGRGLSLSDRNGPRRERLLKEQDAGHRYFLHAMTTCGLPPLWQ
jgi:hypothetical protein